MKKSSNIEAALFNAVWSGTRTKIVMRLADYNDASPVALGLFIGFIDYAEYKPGTERPVAVGNDKVIVRGTSVTEHEAEHETRAHTRSHAYGEATGTMSASSTATGDFSGSGESAGLVMNPPMQLFGPNAPNASMLQYPMSESSGTSSSSGSSSQSATTDAESHTAFEMHGEADTVGHGRSRGRSHAESENETYITRYEWMLSHLYSATEQAERLTGEIMNLALRECFLKIDNQRPIRTRTADLPPAFRSNYFKRIMLPVLGKALAHSPYLMPAAEVDAQIAARNAIPPPTLKPGSQPAAGLPRPDPSAAVIVEAPDKYAADFWQSRPPQASTPQGKKPRPKQRPGRSPKGELPPGASRFFVVDGGKDGGVDNDA